MMMASYIQLQPLTAVTKAVPQQPEQHSIEQSVLWPEHLKGQVHVTAVASARPSTHVNEGNYMCQQIHLLHRLSSLCLLLHKVPLPRCTVQ